MRNKKKICTLLVLMIMGTFTVAQNSVYANEEDSSVAVEQKEIKGNKDALETAQELIDKKDFQGALPYLDAYISSKSKKYEGYKLRGEVYYALRRYDLAAKDFQTAIDLKTDDDKFITGTKVLGAVVLGADKQEQRQNPELGNLYAKLMYAQKALNNPAYETSYAKAVEYNSHIYLPQPKKDEISQINCPQKYGKDFNPQGDDKFLYGAIEDIEKENYRDSIFKSQYIISTYPDYYLGYYLNGVALSALEQEDDALVAFKKALDKNPYDFESLASLGQIYYSSAEKTFSVDDAKKSNEYFKKALSFNPNCNSYYFYIGLNELQLGNINSAIDNFNNAIKLKPNDYNSLYYKLIAQYINGDYSAVVDGSTKLLYKHVSNYNSVLYLRALAYYKTKSYDMALEDLEKIYNNTNDIYNSDIRYVSDKEKTLTSYIYYLKAQILNKMGQGTKSDIARAYQNPIIAKLAIAERVIKPYQNAMRAETVSLDDYNKFSNAYKAVPSLLQMNSSITVEDIDRQYDYIRTTFDDLGITFVYTNPYYQMTVIDNYVAKKYSSKLASQDFQTLPNSAELELRPKNNEKPLLQAHTPQSEILVPENITSIAQMLASQSLTAEDTKTVKSVQDTVPSQDIIAVVSENKPQEVSPIVEQVEDTVQNDQLEIETVVSENVQEPQTSVEEVANESEPEKPEDNNISEKSADEGVKIVAEEIKETEDFAISYPKIAQELVVAKDEVSEAKDVTEKFAEEIEKVTATTIDSQINEKHADINPSDYGVSRVKPMPVIENPDDVVELEPQSFMFKAHSQMPVDSFEIKYPNEVSDDFSRGKLSENTEETQIAQEEIEERIVLPETDEQHSISEKNTSVSAAKKDESVAVPIVMVPEISTPVVKAEDKIQKQLEENEVDKTLVEDVIDNDKNIVETEAVQVLAEAETPLDAEKPAKAAKIKKEKVKKQKIKKAEAEKPVKVKKEKLENEVVEKPVKVKKVKAKKVKPVKEEKITEQEKVINSIVSEAFGERQNEDVSKQAPVKNEVLETPIKEVKPKKENLKKLKQEKQKEEKNVSNAVKKSFWARFKKSEKQEELLPLEELKSVDDIGSEAESPVKNLKPKKEKLKKVKEPKVKKSKLEDNLSADELNVSEVQTSGSDEQTKKKKKKKFHWWLKKEEQQEEQNHSNALSKLFSKTSGDNGEIFIKNDKDRKVIKSREK